jgi:hypothetical protein
MLGSEMARDLPCASARTSEPALLIEFDLQPNFSSELDHY